MNQRALWVVAACVLAAGCGGDGGSGGGETTGKAAHIFALRPVIGESPPPCPEEAEAADGDGGGPIDVVPETGPEGARACLTLGRPLVDASDVRSASVGDLPSGGKAVSIVLGRVGAANLDQFAARSPGKRLAILVKDRLVKAPVVQNRSFAGRIEVVGLSDADATALFEDLRRGQNPSR